MLLELVSLMGERNFYVFFYFLFFWSGTVLTTICKDIDQSYFQYIYLSFLFCLSHIVYFHKQISLIVLF